jgi:hypothetical protein
VCGDQAIPGFEAMLSQGRDRGVVAAIIFQHINQIRARYKELAEPILGYFRNLALFAAGDTVHAEWCSQVVGDERRREWDLGEGIGTSEGATRQAGGGSTSAGSSWNYSSTARIVDRRILPASEFLAIPEPTPERGIEGVFRSSLVGAWQATIPGDWIDQALPRPHAGVPGYIPRPPEHQLLEPFTPEDLERLGLPTSTADRPRDLDPDALGDPDAGMP